uniref:Vacuolar cation/proton exchanger 1a n=1 Tax=Rhizophora mucronata TaxID=61149 RepID=A0A2P2JSF3_RHIMU
MSNLFLKANMIDPACSAAFPTIGSRIMLMKLTEIPQDSDAASIVPTTYSDNIAMIIVMPTNQVSPLQNPMTGFSSSSSSSSWDSKNCLWVFSWKKIYATYATSIAMLLTLDK